MKSCRPTSSPPTASRAYAIPIPFLCNCPTALTQTTTLFYTSKSVSQIQTGTIFSLTLDKDARKSATWRCCARWSSQIRSVHPQTLHNHHGATRFLSRRGMVSGNSGTTQPVSSIVESHKRAYTCALQRTQLNVNPSRCASDLLLPAEPPTNTQHECGNMTYRKLSHWQLV